MATHFNDFQSVVFTGKNKKSYVIHTSETLGVTEVDMVRKLQLWLLSKPLACGGVDEYIRRKLKNISRGAENYKIFIVYDNVDEISNIEGFLLLITNTCGSEYISGWATIDAICINGKRKGIGSKLVNEVLNYLIRKRVNKVAVEIGGGYFNNPGSYKLFKKFFNEWSCESEELPKCFDSVPDKCLGSKLLGKYVGKVSHSKQHATETYPMYLDLNLESKVRELGGEVSRQVYKKLMLNRGIELKKTKKSVSVGGKRKNKSKSKKSKKI